MTGERAALLRGAFKPEAAGDEKQEVREADVDRNGNAYEGDSPSSSTAPQPVRRCTSADSRVT